MSDVNESILLLPHDKLVAKMAQDMYFGNGKPALTVRIALQEEAMETVQTHIAEIKDNQKNSNRLLVGTLISSLGGAILMVFELIKHAR